MSGYEPIFPQGEPDEQRNLPALAPSDAFRNKE